MSREAKILLGIVFVITAGMVALFVIGGDPAPSSEGTDSSKLVRESSHKTGTGPIQVVEFGDYQCPACFQAYPVIQKIKQDYNGKITFSFRNFPLQQHKNAVVAARAAEAAALQNKFWEMHDELYQHQEEWAQVSNPSTFFDRYAKEIGLDVAKFKQDGASAAIKKIIDSDQSDGVAVDVQATPTFFVDGVKADAFDYNTLKTMIDSAKK
ncbi:MAG TPA: thioredoxin domain-containing protein [Candidatus Saccharimonadia bacterium]